MIWWIDLSNWKRWKTDFEYRIWSQTRIFDELAQLIMNYIRAKLTCLHILSKYHIIKTLARRWQITGREWCTGFFFFFVVSDEKNLERDELCNRQRSYHFPLFLVVISITLEKKYKKGCSTIMILLIFRRENSYDWILDDKNNQADDILTYKAVNNN